ncbi:unnamed protein product [Plutella xylostella]|uniref:(diamondback moth) hypothetical protein n=1 Tax=Plutella xylostella TaxID=51655 RepID=A0A8S4E2M4_PLUXY|nr:unnamed protein product [Plutella xylostella]
MRKIQQPEIIDQKSFERIIMPPQLCSTTAAALRKLSDNISKNLSIIRSLDISSDNWDMLNFRKFLRDQADHLESLDPGQPNGPSDAHMNSARKASRIRQKWFKNCGGVILTQHHVLTAAHCLFQKIKDTTAVTGTTILRASKVVIRVGSTYSERGGSKHATSKTVVHEDYKYLKSYDNDVAVLVLPTSMSNYRSSSVQPAAIPPGGYVVPDNASVVAVGWGQTDMNCIESTPLGLRHVGLRTVDRRTCGVRWGQVVPELPDSMLCAGLLGVGGAGICIGDSGGPLVYNGVVVGVTSFLKTCDDSFYPQVFMRVSSYTDWINNTVSSIRSLHMKLAFSIGGT